MSLSLKDIYNNIEITPNGCHLWLGALDKDGYALIKWKVLGQWKTFLGHRLTYKIFRGSIDPKLPLDHICRVHRCINTLHTEQVTVSINTRRSNSANRTHCKYGHELTEDNIKYRKDGWKRCLTCYKRYLKCHTYRIF
jgi:hypothetical protein